MAPPLEFAAASSHTGGDASEASLLRLQIVNHNLGIRSSILSHLPPVPIQMECTKSAFPFPVASFSNTNPNRPFLLNSAATTHPSQSAATSTFRHQPTSPTQEGDRYCGCSCVAPRKKRDREMIARVNKSQPLLSLYKVAVGVDSWSHLFNYLDKLRTTDYKDEEVAEPCLPYLSLTKTSLNLVSRRLLSCSRFQSSFSTIAPCGLPNFQQQRNEKALFDEDVDTSSSSEEEVSDKDDDDLEDICRSSDDSD
ncbi:hypothetical protein LXL04_002975 [Taraxacum kok-saghyz]